MPVDLIIIHKSVKQMGYQVVLQQSVYVGRWGAGAAVPSP